jgi:nitroreductase
MEVLDAIQSRKSIRAFTDQDVSQETIQKILKASQRSPSGTNTMSMSVAEM